MIQVIGFHFVLKDQLGTVLEDSFSKCGHPMLILVGAVRILPALDQNVSDMNVGERKRFTIPAEQAYGLSLIHISEPTRPY